MATRTPARKADASAPSEAPDRREPPAAPWVMRQVHQLLAQRGHARLLVGPSGLGQYRLALSLARAWLCESPLPTGDACGVCTSCHAIDVRAHPDLRMLMPEVQMHELAWPLSEKAQAELDDKKRKPSREIRVDAMRDAVEFAQRTNARGRGKVVLVYPAEQMNTVTANALLKTLEEPVGDVRFILATEAVHQLLPTIRSRCQTHPMAWPPAEEMRQWLVEQGVPAADAPLLLRAAGGRPDDALALMRAGLDPARWSHLPRAAQRGDAAPFGDWSIANVIEALQKICHDQMARASGAEPRFFDAADLPPPPSMRVLAAWSRSLINEARTADHPFQAALALDALVGTAQTALNSRH